MREGARCPGYLPAHISFRGLSKYESGERRLDVVEFLDVAEALDVQHAKPLRVFWFD